MCAVFTLTSQPLQFTYLSEPRNATATSILSTNTINFIHNHRFHHQLATLVHILSVIMPLEQPNFQQIAERLVAVGKELSLCANMPAMQQGQAIIDAINALDRDLRQEMQELRQEIRELRQEMGEHIGGIHKRLDKFTLEMRARYV